VRDGLAILNGCSAKRTKQEKHDAMRSIDDWQFTHNLCNNSHICGL